MYTLTIEHRADLPTESTLAERTTEVVGTADSLAGVRALTHIGRDRLHALRRAGRLARYNVTHN